MFGQALIIRYHGVGPDAPPMFLDRDLFRSQLDCLAECGARTFTVSGLCDAMDAGLVPPRAVALTFDDGLKNVADEVAPLLAEHDFNATFFCVAGRLGQRSDWSQALRSRPQPLLSHSEVAELAEWGFEIGSHGLQHARLDGLRQRELELEVLTSRDLLEDVTGVAVQSFALPYGAVPGRDGRSLLEDNYLAVCGDAVDTVGPESNTYDLARVDAHFLNRPGLLRRALVGSFPPYLRAMRARARARRRWRAHESVPA
jgi:peptidoglycan/xylan/chitin deacetylase (PgdA/CDA1 family)